MARPRKKPNYDYELLAKQITDAVTDMYLNPPLGTEDEYGYMKIRPLAEEFGMTPLKVRKILITAGAFETSVSKQVNDLLEQGCSIAEIQEKMKLSRASVQSYIPYRKAIYNLDEKTLLAERLQKYRQRKSAAAKMEKAIRSMDDGDLESLLWDAIVAFEGYPFKTAKGLRFTYEIKGYEIFFTRREKSVTKASVKVALDAAIELQRSGLKITGPKKLRCFGASYLYPIFLRIGVVQNGDKSI